VSHRVRSLVAYFLAAILLVMVARGVLRAGQSVSDLWARHRALAATTEGREDGPLSVIGEDARAFRALRSRFGPGDRFTIVVSSRRDDPGRYQLAGQSYFYPAIASPLVDANLALVVGGTPADRPRGFLAIAAVDDVWLGRRAR
jgi:hypothetical protein